MRDTGRIGRVAAVAAAAALMGTPAEAYYHYVHYLRNAPYTPVQEKFNLAALPNNTVTFFVTDSGPAVLAPNDNLGSILGEVKTALAAWNSVASSNLRVAFGGTETPGQNSNTPGGNVVFIDLPPGLLGQGAPTVVVGTTTIVAGDGHVVEQHQQGAGTELPGGVLHHGRSRNRTRARVAAHLDVERHVAGRHSEYHARAASRRR